MLRKFSSLGSTFAYKEVLFAKLARRLRLVLANLKERLRFGFELRFQLALISKLSASENGLACGSSFVFDSLLPTGLQPRKFSSLGSTFAYQLGLTNLRERPRFGFELRFQLALISKLSASENGLASDSSFAFGLLSSRSFRPRNLQPLDPFQCCLRVLVGSECCQTEIAFS